VTNAPSNHEDVHAELDLLRGIVSTSSAAVIAIDAATERVVYANERFLMASGVPRDVLYSTALGELPWEVLGDDGARVARHDLPFARVVRTNAPVIGLPLTVRLANQRHHRVRVNATPLRDAQGRIATVVESVEDLSEVAAIESHLLRSLKLESAARLAGGMAHDFNNLLTTIRGHVELLLTGLPADDEHAEDVRAIGSAAERAAALTRQLLAFSRGQFLQPSPLDLNGNVEALAPALQRVVGDRVALRLAMSPTATVVRADPGQLQQVLHVLVRNAGEAMPEGGTLTIETRQVTLAGSAAASAGLPVGDYISLAVRDTGLGMAPAVQAHLFEPFFTTKGPGMGSGLGLAMVYGIMRQSGGGIRARSEAGRGSTFELLFARADSDRPEDLALGDATSMTRRSARGRPSDEPGGQPNESIGAASTDTAVGEGWTRASGSDPARRAQTILLAEDDAAVRSVVCRQLERAGFVVRSAADGAAALQLAGLPGTEIDLLVTDVLMPVMGGRDLATELRRTRPELRVLFISGYLDGDHARLRLDHRTLLLHKPFSLETLLASVLALLATSAAA